MGPRRTHQRRPYHSIVKRAFDGPCRKVHRDVRDMGPPGSSFHSGTHTLHLQMGLNGRWGRRCWDCPIVLKQSVGVPSVAIKTIATSQVTSKTTPPTHNCSRDSSLSTTSSPRPPVATSFRMLSLSSPRLFLLRDTTRNRSRPCRRSMFLFHGARSHSFFFTLRPPPFLVVGTGIFPGPFALGTSPDPENGHRPDETGVPASSVYLGRMLHLFGP